MDVTHLSKKQRRREGKVNKINTLPSLIIARILFFLPPLQAVRTSVLSKKWKRIWKMVVPAIIRPSRWTNPPQFLLLHVLSFTDLRATVSSFRAVCQSWRSTSSITEAVKLPPLEPPVFRCFRASAALTCTTNNMPSEFWIPNLDNSMSNFSLHMDCYYLLTYNAQPPWLVRVREYEPNRFRIMEFCENHPSSLFQSTTKGTAEINLLEYGIQNLSTTWYVQAVSDLHLCTVSKKVVGGWDFHGDNFVFTVLIELQKLDNGGLLGKTESGGLRLLRLDKEGRFQKEEVFRERSDCWILDIACYNRSFFVFDKQSWEIGIINPQEPSIQVKYIVAPDQVTHSDSIKNVYFLPSDVLFLLVDTSNFNGRSLLLYEYKDHKWERVECLADNIFFVAEFLPFSLPSASRKVPWRPGSICFFDCKDIFHGFESYEDYSPEGAEVLNSGSIVNFEWCLKWYNPEDEEKKILLFGHLILRYTEGCSFLLLLGLSGTPDANSDDH